MIIENANLKDTDDLLLDRFFDFIVRDFSKHARLLKQQHEVQMNLHKSVKKPAAGPLATAL
ncbi:MAG: hypothetical protein R2875_18045 [Desulfobacterales bacterium]